MADLAVGLSKSVVEGALTKVRSAIEQDAKLRQKAQRDLVFITLEFEMMQSFLNVANEEISAKNKLVVTWVKHVRELAYDLEDCVEFVVHLDSKPIFWRRLLPSCMVAALPLDQAVEEIQQIKGRVEDVNNCYRRYSLIGDSAGAGSSMPATLQQSGSSAWKKLQGHVNDLTQLVSMNNDDGDLKVISVWGSGGDDLGMTTSVIWKSYDGQEIYRNGFTHRAWVKLVRPFHRSEFTLCLMDQFCAHICHEQGVEIIGDQHEEFLRQLSTKRYLIVLEDVCSMAEWDAIRRFFPKNKNGSCIIVSTKQLTIASLCVGRPYQLVELEQFSADDSVYAFIKKDQECGRHRGKETTDTSTGKKLSAKVWMEKHPLVGRDSEMNDLHQYTIKICRYSIEVMSVWGIAGVGKTALVKNLFCYSILNNYDPETGYILFDKYGWVNVRHPFNLRDFSQSLLLNFHCESLEASDTEHHDTTGNKNPIPECRSFLQKNKCLVVIDGLQSTKEWDSIQAQLVSGSSKSCIIIVTTKANIATHCHGDKGEVVFNVKGLQPDAAFDLFKEEVCRYDQLTSSLFGGNDAELRELISKCGGLPKVTVDIARALATQSVGQMDYVVSLNRGFMHQLETDPEFRSLQSIFGWMNSMILNPPAFLKPCIFYLSIFPHDTTVRRRRLVRRWIAEGYSKGSAEEDSGEKFFSELLELNIFQQVPDARMVFYQVNGFIREYIISRQMEENLVFELGGNCAALTTQSRGRHLIVLKRWDRDRIVFGSIDFSRLRSLTVLGKWESFLISKSMKMLRVLDLEDASGVMNSDVEKMVKILHRLKFLSLRGRHEIYHLPCSLDHLKQLQTLDVRGTSILTLPKNITKLQKLQYIRAGTTEVPVSAPPPSISSRWFCRRRRLVGVVMPRGIGKLTALHTLGVVNVAASGSKTFVKDLKKLTQLRKLGVSGINRKNSEKFFSAISGHLHLESLSVQFDNKDTQGCSFKNGLEAIESLEKLRSLKLYGIDYKLPEWGRNKFSKLEKLYLEKATLMEQEIKFLGELPQLCILRVKQLQDGELQFHVIVDGEEEYSFQKVKVLQISFGSSSSTWHVKFGEETMKNLELLKVDCYGGSPTYRFSGLENLQGLKQVLLLNGSNAQALKEQLESQLAEHPNKPVVKLEEHLCLS